MRESDPVFDEPLLLPDWSDVFPTFPRSRRYGVACGVVLIGAALIVGLASCTPSPQPVAVTPPKTICPPDPGPGSGFVCSAPVYCLDAPKLLADVQNPITSVLVGTRRTDGIAKMLAGATEVFCQ